MRKLAGAAGAVVLLAVAGAGCGGGGESPPANGATEAGSQSQGQQAVCASLGDLSAALKKLQNLDPKTATAAEIKADAANAQAAARNARDAAEAQSKQQVRDVEDAVASLQAAVAKVPAGTSPAKELQEVEPQLKNAATLVQSEFNGLSCAKTS